MFPKFLEILKKKKIINKGITKKREPLWTILEFSHVKVLKLI